MGGQSTANTDCSRSRSRNIGYENTASQSPAWLHVVLPGLGPGAERFTSSSGRFDRQRPEQDLVEEREDRGIGAKPERQRQNGDAGDERRLEQRAERKSQVAHVNM